MSAVYNMSFLGGNDTINLITDLLPVPIGGRTVHELLLACQSPKSGILSIHLKFQIGLQK